MAVMHITDCKAQSDVLYLWRLGKNALLTSFYEDSQDSEDILRTICWSRKIKTKLHVFCQRLFIFSFLFLPDLNEGSQWPRLFMEHYSKHIMQPSLTSGDLAPQRDAARGAHGPEASVYEPVLPAPVLLPRARHTQRLSGQPRQGAHGLQAHGGGPPQPGGEDDLRSRSCTTDWMTGH